jgi:hypothetical protein
MELDTCHKSRVAAPKNDVNVLVPFNAKGPYYGRARRRVGRTSKDAAGHVWWSVGSYLKVIFTRGVDMNV